MTSTVSSSSDSVRGALPGSGVPGSRVAPVGDEPALREWASELVERARADGVELTGENGLLTALVRQVLQTGLEVEMTDHLGYEPHAVDGRGTGNSRNGSYPKTVTTEVGQVRLRVPRDRNASFDPVTVPKGQRRLDGLTGNVVSLYAKGVTTGDAGWTLKLGRRVQRSAKAAGPSSVPSWTSRRFRYSFRSASAHDPVGRLQTRAPMWHDLGAGGDAGRIVGGWRRSGVHETTWNDDWRVRVGGHRLGGHCGSAGGTGVRPARRRGSGDDRR